MIDYNFAYCRSFGEVTPMARRKKNFNKDENPTDLSETTRVVFSEEINPHDG